MVFLMSHGALTPPYEDRPISAAGKERIAASMRAYWQRVRSGEVIRPATKKRERVPSLKLAKWSWKETDEQAKARRDAYLKERFPGSHWG